MAAGLPPSAAGAGERLRRLLPALWLGLLLCVALVATPAPFATLERADAGRVVARILAQEAWLSLVLAALLLLVERVRTRRRAAAGQGTVLGTDLLLLMGTLFCTVAGYFGVQPLLPAARAGDGVLSFGQLHLASTVFFGVKTVLVAALAWRAARPADGLSLPPSS